MLQPADGPPAFFYHKTSIMNFLRILAFSLFALSSLFAQEGIQFEKGNWNDIMAKAKAENKLVFMDAYASWCGPCKMMSRDVFSQASVGAFFNENFINAKIDMEEGEGPDLSNLYGVMAYPTLLFIDSDGELAHRAVGYHGVEQFLELGKTALDPNKRMSTLTARYAKGDRSPEFLYNYAMAAMNSMDPNAEQITLAYLETQEDWSTEDNMRLIFESASGAEPKLFDYIAEHRAAFAELYGEDVVNGQLQRLIISTLDPNVTDEQETFKKIDEAYQKAFPEDAASLSANFRMNYYGMIGDMGKFAEEAAAYFEKHGSDDSMELNNIAWSFFESVDDKKMLEKAVQWAEKSVKLEDAYYNNDTLASLYFKLGNKKKAKKAAEHAIQLAKENGEDYSATQELLERINEL